MRPTWLAARRRPRSRSRFAAVAIGLSAVVVAAGCASQTEVGGSRMPQSESWSALTGGPEGWQRTSADAPDLELEWARPLGAPAVGLASSDTNQLLFQATISETGCNYYALSADDGRRVWCLRLATSGRDITGTVDGRGTTFVPLYGGVGSVSHEGEFRWFGGTEGVPTSITMLNNRHVLTITQFGVAQVFNTHTGYEIAVSRRLAGDVPREDSDFGLAWCDTGTRGCPVSAPAAVDPGNGDGPSRVYVSVWPMGEDTPVLLALEISDEPTPTFTELWRTPLTAGRNGTAVVLSSDRDRLYVTGENGRLSAFSTEDGAPEWETDVGYLADFPPAETSRGDLVSGGRSTTTWRGEDDDHPADAGPAPVVSVAADGSERWRRDDLRQLANPAATADDKVVVAVRSGENGVALHVLDAGDGETLRDIEVTGAEGPVSGVSIDDEGRLAVTTNLGVVHLYS